MRLISSLYAAAAGAICTLCLLSSQTQAQTAPLNLNLPQLGDSASGFVSHQQEHQLGRTWLRLFRKQIPASNDALVFSYVDQLTKRLAQSSNLENKALEIIVVRNKTLNAFAVPGGIVGVHTGLFMYADSEEQLASVLSHELAHISQRHWVRSVEKAQQNRIPTMAGVLASLALMATTGSDAGIAALMATQAANLESQLRFSRENEAEADRVGMQTLVNAGYSPQAMVGMFENMLRASRFSGDRPPEFLLSHPITEKRIADSQNRSSMYPPMNSPASIEYDLVKSRIRVAMADNHQIAIKTFQAEVKGVSKSPDASRYGLAYAQLLDKQYAQAEATLAPLLKRAPQQVFYQLLQAEIEQGQQQHPQALARVEAVLAKQPNHYAANLLTAKILENLNQYEKAVKQLERLLPRYETQPQVWYELAEVRGLARDTTGVHLARAEYFQLTGDFERAKQHLSFALQDRGLDNVRRGRIQERMRIISEMASQDLNV